GVESTVVDLTSARPRLLRPGGVDAAAIEAVLGRRLVRSTASSRTSPRRAPGQLESHYAPRAKLRLRAARPRAGEAYLGFGKLPPGIVGPAMTLSATRDLDEAAANLFAMLRALDRRGITAIAVATVPRHGLGLAINDRLARAAAPRR
ncbi:MAG: translation factor Sua5, partial [Alphaproteobacteria bacterium]|nr:translation factor Sua5 [Alphaproteobacteria bacterium]